jgi:hypothetical protein
MARPSVQLCLCQWQLCADGDLACLPYPRVVSTTPTNCRRYCTLVQITHLIALLTTKISHALVTIRPYNLQAIMMHTRVV